MEDASAQKIGSTFAGQLWKSAKRFGSHGTFIFGEESSLQYVDLESTNGSYVDGVRIEPNTPVALCDWSVVGIPPFLLIVRLNRSATSDPAEGSNRKTPTTQLISNREDR